MKLWLLFNKLYQFVDCHSDRMEVHLRFFAPFNGFIYAENYHEKPSCSWYGNLTDYMKLTIPFSVKRSGIMLTILTVSPLVGVLVAGTTSLQVSCLYTVKDFTVTFPRVPVKSVTDSVTGLAAKPTLFMQILDDHGINGAVLTEANIGQRITLDVVLENAAIYDFTIYSCIAHDGSRTPDASVQIVDANGCGIPLIRAIEDQIYNATINGAKHIYIYLYGFQFTSSEYVHFECQARTCVHSCLKQQCLGTKLNSQAIINHKLNKLRRRYVESREQTNLTLYAKLQLKPQIINKAKLGKPQHF
uniref:ZP domain-containing protein n=1 Tax=Syphacia muris TaxID=451379 RepID=A0A0N5ATT3_9BILA